MATQRHAQDVRVHQRRAASRTGLHQVGVFRVTSVNYCSVLRSVCSRCASDRWPDGCPCGCDPIAVTHRMKAAGIVLYTVGCEPAISQHAGVLYTIKPYP